MNKLILCCGVGGTGKSTWAAAQQGYYHFQSPTRQVMHSLGINSQKEAEALTLDQRRYLQAKIFITYADRLLQAVETYPKVVADRSPFCMVGYATRSDRESLPFYEWPVRNLWRRLPKDTTVRYFPYPPPFDVPDDGFRHQIPEKEAAFDRYLCQIMQSFQIPWQVHQ